MFRGLSAGCKKHQETKDLVIFGQSWYVMVNDVNVILRVPSLWDSDHSWLQKKGIPCAPIFLHSWSQVRELTSPGGFNTKMV